MMQARLDVLALSSLLALMLFCCAINAAGDIDWTGEVIDPRGDVRDNLGSVAAGRGDIDILSVLVTDAGADLNVTLKLAEDHNSAAEYTIDLLVDEIAAYRLTWSRAFAAKGPSGAAIAVTGHTSRDGTVLTWVMAKSRVAVTAALRIDQAEAKLSLPGGLAYTDTAAVQLPKSISVQVVYEQLHMRKVTVTVVYDGANASAVRAILDLDTDGRVSATEADAYATKVREGIAPESRLPTSTLDSRTATHVSYSFDLQGVQGTVMGTSPVQFTMMQALEFPLPETRSSHVYYFETAIGGDEPWENEPYGDDPWGDECIGGDDPWENVFFNGLVPWGSEAIGGDEPWDNKVNVLFTLEAPDGWRFVTEGWPSGLADHLNTMGDVLEMDSEAAATSYAATMGRLNMIEFEELSRDVAEGFMPACWAMLALAATGRTAMLIIVRRRRALRS